MLYVKFTSEAYLLLADRHYQSPGLWLYNRAGHLQPRLRVSMYIPAYPPSLYPVSLSIRQQILVPLPPFKICFANMDRLGGAFL
jgi:hypothetical protein